MIRRNFLKIVGGGVVLAAAGATAFATTRRPNVALAPWDYAGQGRYDDPRLDALSYAILAPNPHNRQPWKVELVEQDALTLWFDLDKQLPHTDPFDRQLTIGLGCFLEILELAANAAGYSVVFELFPEGSDDQALTDKPIAHVSFKKSETKTDPLTEFILARRSTKEVYDTNRPIADDILAGVLASTQHIRAFGSVDADMTKYLRELTEQALLIELNTPHTYKESVDLFRIGKKEVNANPDGLDFSGALFDVLHASGAFNRENALDKNSMAFKGGIDRVTKACRSSMGHIWIVTEANTRFDQIAAGRDWVRLNLATTRAGLGVQPMSQALQEYPEMATLYEEVHQQLAPNGGTVQMLARIGYGPTVPASPRWPIEAKMVASE